MGYQWDFYFIWGYYNLFIEGVFISLGFCVVTIAIGLIIGLFCGLSLLSRHRLLSFPVRSYVEVFRCTPLLVQIIWIYYALPVIININIPAYLAGGMALTCYISSFYAEIFRGGVISIERGQWDAARALGMTYPQLMKRIILPQAIKRMVPPFMNQSVIQLKNTSLLSILAVGDILYQGSVITSATYRPLEVYTIVAIIYFVILYPLTILAQRLEARVATKE